jgi:hypothetical protein
MSFSEHSGEDGGEVSKSGQLQSATVMGIL